MNPDHEDLPRDNVSVLDKKIVLKEIHLNGCVQSVRFWILIGVKNAKNAIRVDRIGTSIQIRKIGNVGNATTWTMLDAMNAIVVKHHEKQPVTDDPHA